MSLYRERLKTYAKLRQKKYRSLHKQCIIEGVRAIRDIVAADHNGRLIDALIYTPGFIRDERNEKLVMTVRDHGGKTYEAGEKELARLSETVANQDCIAIANQWNTSIDHIVHQSAFRSIVALDNVSEPGNLGALIRTCDWFGVDALLLGTGTVEIWNPKVLRAAVGSMVHIQFAEDVDLERELPALRMRGYNIVGTSVHEGTPVTDTRPAMPAVIVFGNEADGISSGVERVIDTMITVPKYGKAESLNVAVAAGVILSAIRFASQK